MEYEDQKRMTWNHEEDFELEWICAVWVHSAVYPREREREREREKERERAEHITNQKRKEKI